MFITNAIRHFHFQKTQQVSTLLHSRKVHFDGIQNKVAKISFSDPNGKVGVLSLARLEAFGALLTQMEDLNIEALVINIDNLAGADLKMIQEGLDDPVLLKKIVETGHRVFYQLALLPIPTFAFIRKACLGGALELGLPCDYRVVEDDPKTILGLPEVKLGLFPCWGGTQRFPRLVGGTQALNMIMNGELVTALQARQIQLADAIFSREMIKEKGEEFIHSCLTPEGKKQVEENRRHIQRPAWPGFSEERYKTAGMLACELIYASNTLPLKRGLKLEKDTFLGMSPEEHAAAKGLVTAFLEKKPPFASNRESLS